MGNATTAVAQQIPGRDCHARYVDKGDNDELAMPGMQQVAGWCAVLMRMAPRARQALSRAETVKF
jgi:hypothetical protein